MGETGIEDWRDVKKIHMHSQYAFKDNYMYQKMTAKAFDIAILELEQEIDLTKFAPACLSTINDGTTFDAKDVTVVGWGRSQPFIHQWPVITNKPHEANLTVEENCQSQSGPWVFCVGKYNPGKGLCFVSLDLID